MPAALHFTGRNRRPPRDPVNACLSLGYTLLHMQAVHACAVAGLDPLLGFYHRPAFGRESLACDLIEPLRPAADLWVWNLLRTRTLREDHFTLDKGACLLGKAGRAIFYAEWERSTPPWRRWLRSQTQMLARSLRQQGQAWLEHSSDDDETP
jgi:CRISPR-associated protein Cas1